MTFRSSKGNNTAPFTYFYLEVFTSSKLLPTSLIPLDALETCFKFDLLHFDLTLSYFDEKGKLTKRDFAYDLSTLLKECKEVQEFATKYYPEYVI